MTIIVSDTFTDTTGTDVSAHTPDIDTVGGGWSDDGANTCEIKSNNIGFSAANTSGWINTGVTDHGASFDVNAGGADNRWIVSARRNTALSGAETCYELNGQTGNNLLAFLSRVAGAGTIIGATIPYTLGASTTYDVELVVNGTSLEGFINGVSIGTRTSSTITTGTYAGVRHALYTDSALRVDNFVADDLVAAGPAKGSHSLLGVGI